MDEVGAKFNTLSKNEQAYITTAMFGTFQRNKGLTLLQNYNQSLKNYETAIDSAGTAQQKFDIYQESSAAKIDKFKASMEGFWQNLISSDLIKTSIDSLGRLIQILDTLVNNSFSQFIIKVALTTGAIATLGIGLNALKASYLGTTLGVIALDVAEKGLLATTKTLTATMLKSPLFWIAAGVTVIYGVINAVDALTVSVEEQRQKVEDLTKKYDDLKSKIEELKSIENPTQNQQQYIALLEKELSLQQAILKTEKERLMQKEVFGEGVLGNGIEGEVEAAKGFLDNYKDYVKNVQQQISDLQSQGLSADFYIKDLEESKNALREYELGLIENRKTLQDYMDYFGKETPDNVKQLATQIDGLIKKFDEYNPVVKESADKTKESIEQQSQAFKSIIEDAEKYKETIDDLNKEISSSINTIQSLNTAIQELSTKEGLSAKSLEDLITNYPDLIMYLDDEKRLKTELNKILENETESQKQLFKSKLELSTQYFNQMIKGNAEVWNIISKYYNNDANSFKTVADVKKKINDSLVKYIGESWSNLYDNEIQAISTIEYGLRTGLNQVRDDVTRKRMLEQLADVQKQREILESINKPLELTVDKINFEKLNEPKKTEGNKNDPEINKKEIDQFYKLQEAIDRTNNSIENNKKLLSNTDEDEEKIKTLEKLISLYKEQQKQLHNIAEARRNSIEKNVSTLEGYGFDVSYDRNSNDLRIANEEYINKIYGKNNEETNKIRDTIEDIIKQTKEWNKNNIEAGSEWQNLSGYIKGSYNDISDIYKKQSEDLEKIREEQEKFKQEQKKLWEDSNKQVIDLLKKRYEKEKKIKEQEHKDTIDRLDDELDAYKKYVDDRLKEIDRLYDTEDYQKNISDKSKEILDVQNEIDKYLLAAENGDLESLAKVKELNKEKLKLEGDLQNTQRDREKDLRKQNIQDNLSDFEKFIDAKKESENKSFDEYQSQLEQSMSDTSLALESQKLLMTGTITEVQNALVQLFTDVGENATISGKLIQDEIINRLSQLKNIGVGLNLQSNSDMFNLFKKSGSLLSAFNVVPNSISNTVNNYINKIPTPTSGGYGFNIGDINISVAGNATPSGASKLAGDVVAKMKDMMFKNGVIKR